MGFKVGRVDTWAASLVDRPGGLAEKLAVLATAGVNLDFVIARRESAAPGTGVVFVAPIAGAARIKAAKNAGFHKTKSLHSVRVEGADKPGQAAKMADALGRASVNLRGFSAAAMGKKFVAYISVDTNRDAAKAVRVLKALP